MKLKLKQLLNDIKTGTNIDVYLTIIICAVLIFLDILGVTSASWISSGILAVLLLIALGTLSNRRTDERLKETVEELKTYTRRDFFSEWDETSFRECLPFARSISLIAVSNYQFINSNIDGLRDFISRGGKLRCILIEPEGTAVKMAADREFGASKQPSYISTQIHLTLELFRELASAAPNTSSVQVKLVDHLPFMVATIVDRELQNGIMFVTLFGFGYPSPPRPSFVLRKDRDSQWFAFFQNSYENIWQWSECQSQQITDLTDGGRTSVSMNESTP